MYISYIVLCDIYIMKLMYVYVQTLIMLLRLGMHTKYINKNKNKNNNHIGICYISVTPGEHNMNQSHPNTKYFFNKHQRRFIVPNMILVRSLLSYLQETCRRSNFSNLEKANPHKIGTRNQLH